MHRRSSSFSTVSPPLPLLNEHGFMPMFHKSLFDLRAVRVAEGKGLYQHRMQTLDNHLNHILMSLHSYVNVFLNEKDDSGFHLYAMNLMCFEKEENTDKYLYVLKEMQKMLKKIMRK